MIIPHALLPTVAILVLTIPAFAQDIAVHVNGEPVRFSGMGPQQYQGRVFVPLRGVLEKLGAFVDWVPSTRTVVASRGDMDLQLQIGSRVARVNGREVALDVPAMSMGGSTMVPLRFVGETLGAEIRWDAPTRTVLISTGPQTPGAPTQPTTPTGPAQPTVNPTLDSITHNQRTGWLKPGDVLAVTMSGTPGAEASFRIPGVVDRVALRETSPGRYTGSWTVPADRPLQITDAAVLGSLSLGSRLAPIVQAGDTLRIDTVPPRIADVTPAGGTAVGRGRPLVSATFADQSGSGVPADRTRIVVDGKDVTSEASVTGRFFSWQPPRALSAGKHTVEVSTTDQAGNTARQSWTFEVTESAVAGIKSVETNARGTLEPGDTVNVRAQAMPGGRMTFSLGPVKNQPMTEQSPGVYVGSYTIRKGDDVGQAPVTVNLVSAEGERFTEVSDRKVQVNTGPPTAPVITSPGPSDRVKSPLIVRGTATPNATVRLKVDYVNRVLGPLGVRGTAAQQDITVGKDGRWESKPLDVSTLLGTRDTEYTITVTAVNAAGDTSPVTTLRLR